MTESESHPIPPSGKSDAAKLEAARDVVSGAGTSGRNQVSESAKQRGKIKNRGIERRGAEAMEQRPRFGDKMAAAAGW